MRFQRSAASRDIRADHDERAVTVTPRKHEAAGVWAVMMTNPLVPFDHTAAKSNTPVSKAITMRAEPVSVAVGALPAREGRSGERT